MMFKILQCHFFFSAMLEPSPRYSSPASVGGGPGRLQIEAHTLDTAVDLSRKSSDIKIEVEADPEDSEDEAPLDLKVRPASSASIDSRPAYETHGMPSMVGIAESKLPPSLAKGNYLLNDAKTRERRLQ